jgi:hypothetical protein
MIVLGQFGQHLDKPELIVGVLGLVVLSVCAIWGFLHWLFDGPRSPDPWDSEIAAELDAGNCTPICHHCLTPHDPSTNFCPNCGAAVGEYTNLLPYIYLFSIGHALRVGTSEKFRRSPLTIAGFFFFAIAEYALFAPVYWFKFLKNLRQPAPPSAQGDSGVIGESG